MKRTLDPSNPFQGWVGLVIGAFLPWWIYGAWWCANAFLHSYRASDKFITCGVLMAALMMVGLSGYCLLSGLQWLSARQHFASGRRDDEFPTIQLYPHRTKRADNNRLGRSTLRLGAPEKGQS